MEIEDAFTTLRIILSPVVMALILSNEIVAAFYLYLVAAITDIFDGNFARKRKKVSETGELFDALADFTLVYLAIIAIAISRKETWIIALIIVSLALAAYAIGIISMKKRYFTIPHLKSAKVFAWFVHPVVMVYIINWDYAGTLLLMGVVVGIYTAIDYIVYALKQKNL